LSTFFSSPSDISTNKLTDMPRTLWWKYLLTLNTLWKTWSKIFVSYGSLRHSCMCIWPWSAEWRTREEARPHFLFPLRRFSLLSFTNCDPINNNWSLIEQHPDVRILFMAMQSAKGSLSALSTGTVRIQRVLHAHCRWRQQKDRGSWWEWSSICKNGI
jgi:hypothetical protein